MGEELRGGLDFVDRLPYMAMRYQKVIETRERLTGIKAMSWLMIGMVEQ